MGPGQRTDPELPRVVVTPAIHLLEIVDGTRVRHARCDLDDTANIGLAGEDLLHAVILREAIAELTLDAAAHADDVVRVRTEAMMLPGAAPHVHDLTRVGEGRG